MVLSIYDAAAPHRTPYLLSHVFSSILEPPEDLLATRSPQGLTEARVVPKYAVAV